MKIYKVVLSVIDIENLGADGICDLFETVKYINPHVRSIISRDIGEWSDDHVLNKRDTADAEFKRLFAGTE